MEDSTMRDEYDFSDSAPNPYAKKLRKSVTMRIDVDTLDYFKSLAAQTGIPYQNLINLYLGQCAKDKRQLRFQ
ncbi:hypothetical protein KIH77_07210 [Bifidobacterium sp. 82T24]|uniref:CopG family antitoxin n=1 Tax=Bifidobacterium pluvialisilvae TaxID=2834436 RepID=UPI001C5984AE|nr:CopG family antitoxin [Bifidobacterium pluvialisilvae]MBW3088518.1 hypothetical protein [Bifidobacterium pluvialisilvae]